MLVKDLMTTGASCLKPEASVIHAAKQMRKEDIGSIPVCNDKGEILGIVTDRDIVIRALATDAGNALVSDIMSSNVVFVTPDTKAHDAALILSKNKIRRLPVVVNGKIVGMLSLGDVARKRLLADEAGDILSALSRK